MSNLIHNPQTSACLIGFLYSPSHQVILFAISQEYIFVNMGRTIPSYRIATEIERIRWRPFRSMLNKKDRKLFDNMLNLPRLYNTAGMMVCRPVVFHSVIISILFYHYKQLQEMVKRAKDRITTDQLNICPKCKRGMLETTRNKKVSLCDNCGWAKIEMTMAYYEEIFRKLKMNGQQKMLDYENGPKTEM